VVVLLLSQILRPKIHTGISNALVLLIPLLLFLQGWGLLTDLALRLGPLYHPGFLVW